MDVFSDDWLNAKHSTGVSILLSAIFDHYVLHTETHKNAM